MPPLPRPTRRLLLGLAACWLAAPPSRAADAPPETVVLRRQVVVDATAIRLGDLFEGLDAARAEALVGAAPAPGRRILIETAQIAALARQHRLAWRPLSANERAVVERPGRAVPREEIEVALRQDLLRLGLDPTAELELGPLLTPMVPPTALVQITTEGVSFDAAQGRFAATLAVAAEGMPMIRQRVSGRAVPTLAAIFATRRLALGEVVRPGDVRAVRLRAERVRPGAADDPEQVVGQQLRRPVATGQPFMTADLGAPLLVEKNMLVTMVLEGPGLQLTAKGRALAGAARGATVAVVNLSSQTIVEGAVIGPGRVRIAPGGAR